jgi:hypothetical protein
MTKRWSNAELKQFQKRRSTTKDIFVGITSFTSRGNEENHYKVSSSDFSFTNMKDSITNEYIQFILIMHTIVAL